MRDICRQYM